MWRETWRRFRRSKLALAVCLLVLMTGTAVSVFTFHSLATTTEELAGNVFREVSAHAVSETRNFVLRAEPILRSLQHLAGSGDALVRLRVGRLEVLFR